MTDIVQKLELFLAN